MAPEQVRGLSEPRTDVFAAGVVLWEALTSQRLFRSGFRPLRNVPAFPSPPTTRVTTVLDEDSQTPTHLRLTSTSEDDAWPWTWDFYVTHATLTLQRAPEPTGFGYRCVPAGALTAEDLLMQPDGSSQGARNSFNADLAGPVEAVSLVDTTLGRSLFMIHHFDDELPERYQVRDNDSAHWLFGSGRITDLPTRFSFGLIDTADAAALRQRIDFVATAMQRPGI